MGIREIIDSLEIDNIQKNKLLMCLLRNTDNYHSGLRNTYINLYCLEPRDISLSKIVETIIESDDNILINYLVKTLKTNFFK